MADNAMVRNGLLIDLDGVVYQSESVIEGSLPALDWIRRERIPHLFVTNTSSRCRESLLRKFEQFGFSADLDEVMTPIVAVAEFLKRHELRKIAAFVSADARRDLDDFDILADTAEAAVDAVVIGDLGEAWDYQRLNLAFRLLMRDPAPQLLALGMTRYWRGQDGLLLDVAPFVKALEHAANCEARVVGKPAAAFFDASLARLGRDAAQVFMIGDDINGDIDAAQRCGIRGIQVRTGKFREADLEGEVQPFAILDSIAALPDWWTHHGD
jgi:phospholysine phosphohistidine inorganic pyrophosphate phosphatase